MERQALNNTIYTKEIMTKVKFKDFIGTAFLMVIAFAVGGTGLWILYNTKGDFSSIIGGFILAGIAIAIFYKLIKEMD